MEIWRPLGYCLCAIDVISLEMVIVDCTVNSKVDLLVLRINDRGLSEGVIEAVDFTVGPRDIKV